MADHLKTGQIDPAFKWHSKTRPFHFRTQIDHLNIGINRISDVHCSSESKIILELSDLDNQQQVRVSLDREEFRQFLDKLNMYHLHYF